MSAPLLEVRDLRTWFFKEEGLARAVDGVSFEVGEGETVGIVGESGCGKSVTALSILGLHARPSGRILEGSSVRFRGEELVGAPEARLRRLRGGDISMVFQEPATSLNPVRRVGAQVAEALVVHGRSDRRAAGARTGELLAEVGLDDAQRIARAYPHQLSGGMCQRVMIAMALACEPALLVADEPTTSLDVTTQAQILDLLASLRARHGMSLLLITHDLGVIAEMCDRVLVMYAGQIVESGTADEVLRDARHPYTRGLLASVPRRAGTGRLAPIPGVVPAASAWPGGCRFRDRCPSAMPECRREPPTVQLSAGRGVACWLEAEGVRAGGAEGDA
ncbi:MAG TPA: ABC transporter ATP-binding protein [Longimicrobiales bacterium]|nr:ABC transporter ATP-binding protein [Longimicrobiales bacterium]